MQAVREAGFDGCCAPLAIEDGHELLGFIPGEVAHVPYPTWAQADGALGSAAALLRRLHEASRSFDPSGGTWADELADPEGGQVVCHNDVCLENVVFRDGQAVALLDFDYAAPGRPLHDLAHFARMCVPLDDDESARLLGWSAPDRLARLRLVAEAYGIEPDRRQDWLSMIDQSVHQSGRFVAGKVQAGEPGFLFMWEWIGGAERFERRERWWREHRSDFARALS